MKKNITICLFFITIAIKVLYSQPQNPYTPPEYFPSKAVLIEWDFNTNTWPLYSNLINICQSDLPVILVVRNLTEENQILTRLNNDGVPVDNISFVHVPCQRMWIRDHGPLSIMTDNGLAFMDFDDLANSGLDEDLPTNLANIWGLDSYQIPWILCGGNFMVNSYNTLFTTNRLYGNNPLVAQSSINNDLLTYMGIDNIITVKAQHDDYWGHIDMQIKLLDDTTFVIASVDIGSGPNYDSLEYNFNLLSNLISPSGNPYRIERLPMASNWKTYANSLILNNIVIVPTYNDVKDSLALGIYQQLLPNKQIVGLNCNSIIGWEGAVHCITMQIFDDGLLTRLNNLSLRNNKIITYPNPLSSGSTLTVVISEDIDNPKYFNIYNLKGQLVFSYNQLNNSNIFQIPIDLKPDIYILSIIGNDYAFSKRITVIN